MVSRRQQQQQQQQLLWPAPTTTSRISSSCPKAARRTFEVGAKRLEKCLRSAAAAWIMPTLELDLQRKKVLENVLTWYVDCWGRKASTMSSMNFQFKGMFYFFIGRLTVFGDKRSSTLYQGCGCTFLRQLLKKLRQWRSKIKNGVLCMYVGKLFKWYVR